MRVNFSVEAHTDEDEESGLEQCGCGHEHGVRGHHSHQGHVHRHHLHELHQEAESGESDSEMETSDSSEGLNLEGLDMETLRQRAELELHKQKYLKQHRHLKGESSEEIDPEDEEEEELDSDFLDSDDEEVRKRIKIKVSLINSSKAILKTLLVCCYVSDPKHLVIVKKCVNISYSSHSFSVHMHIML